MRMPRFRAWRSFLRQSSLQISLVGALCLAAGQAGAQILIGQTAGFSGPVAGGVKETTDGARLYIDSVNAKGGVNGETIELVSLDDRFEPKQAEANARELITKRNVAAMFLTRGTPHTQAIVPLLNEHHIALIGPSTGAMALHQPVQPYVFNVRSAYQREAERAIRHLSLIGLSRIAVLQADDSFGADVIVGAQAGFEATSKKPLLIEKFDRAQKDFAAIAAKVAKEDPQAVLFIGSGQVVADGVAALRAAGSRAQIVTTSNNASADFIRQLGASAHGTIITQVFPYERSLAAPIVKEAIDLAAAKNNGTSVSPAMMEGFAAAKVLVEALRRAGPKPSRDKIVAALNGMRKVDFGGMELGYSPTDHTGFDFVDLSIVGANGKFLR